MYLSLLQTRIGESFKMRDGHSSRIFPSPNHSCMVHLPSSTYISVSPKHRLGWWFQPLWKICSSVGIMIFPTEWKNQIHVPNHQPAEVFRTIYNLHQFSTGPLPVFQAIFVKDLLVFQMLSPRPTRWGPWCENRLNRAWPEGKHIYIYATPPPPPPAPKIFCWCQRGSICWEPFAKTK